MADPYKVLGVTPDASDAEIKKAYKQLVKKYHPDRFSDPDMAELANQKMTEINTAYDSVMDDRKNGVSRPGQRSYGYKRYDSSAYGGGTNYRSYSYVDYRQVRSFIQRGDLSSAENMLNSVEEISRNAEWYFLKGTICYQRGWLNDAYNYIVKATQMDPANREYLTALEQMNRQRSGYMYASPRTNEDSLCDLCTGICILDSCCECMGGDCVPCC